MPVRSGFAGSDPEGTIAKGDARLRTIPIMAVTAYSGRDDEDRVRAAGANAYITKPISVVRFVGEVRALLPVDEVRAEPTDDSAERDPEPDAPTFPSSRT